MSDLDVLADIEESAGTLFIGTHMAWAASSPKRPRDTYLPSLSQGLLWVADVGEVVGFIAASEHTNFIFVEEMSVVAEQQRRGLGRALLIALVSAAAERGSAAVALVTDRELPWNRQFYERAGFSVFRDQLVPSALAGYLMQQVSRSRDPSRRCGMYKLFSDQM